jgi:hypothetical protein
MKVNTWDRIFVDFIIIVEENLQGSQTREFPSGSGVFSEQSIVKP